jgi:hypothetical protein
MEGRLLLLLLLLLLPARGQDMDMEAQEEVRWVGGQFSPVLQGSAVA